MKKLILFFALMAFVTTAFSQRLVDKDTSQLNDNTLFAVQDSTKYYDWDAIDFKTLRLSINPFRTYYGNLAISDSINMILNKDSTVFNSQINANGILLSKSGTGVDAFKSQKFAEDWRNAFSIADNSISHSHFIQFVSSLEGSDFQISGVKNTIVNANNAAYRLRNTENKAGILNMTVEMQKDRTNGWNGYEPFDSLDDIKLFRFNATNGTQSEDYIDVYRDSTVVHNKLIIKKSNAWIWDYNSIVIGRNNQPSSGNSYSYGNGSSRSFFKVIDTCYLYAIQHNGNVLSDTATFRFVYQLDTESGTVHSGIDTTFQYNNRENDKTWLMNDLILYPNRAYSIDYLTGSLSQSTMTITIRRKEYLNFD